MLNGTFLPPTPHPLKPQISINKQTKYQHLFKKEYKYVGFYFQINCSQLTMSPGKRSSRGTEPVRFEAHDEVPCPYTVNGEAGEADQ